jgi:hypothetical protein
VVEFGREVSDEELCDIMVVDTLTSLAEVDWRDFFPYLGWIPNKRFDAKVLPSEARRTAVTRALINYRKERIERGEVRWNQPIHMESFNDYMFLLNRFLRDM